ncbi:MAG TPA: hypothetical protein VH419_01720 [Nocardioidaceae bacterium]|jgi:hypothetical protein
MAIGSLDKAGRLEQLKTYARVQVWSGYRSPADVRSDVYDALLDEVKDPSEAERLTSDYLVQAERDLESAAAEWPDPSAFDRLQATFEDLREQGLIVLEACEDHWSANAALETAGAEGPEPAGIAYFTHADVWHAVEHGMLELNVWHPSTANVAPGDPLLERVQEALARHRISSVFDEGRIEVSVAWERRPARPHSA